MASVKNSCNFIEIVFMYEHAVSRIAIYILSIVMIAFGIYHFLHPKNLIVYLPQFVPGGLAWIYIVGSAFILAAIAFIVNRMARLAGYLLAIMLFTFVLTIHLPNYLNAGDSEMRQLALVNLLKDMALAAFALHIAANAKTVE
jgi:putative oxidoreductase